MDKKNIWTAVLSLYFMMGVGVFIGISLGDISEIGLLIFWGIWLIGVGFLLTRLK